MKFGSGVLLVAVGLFVLWFAMNGRLSRFLDLWSQSGDGADAQPATNAASNAATRLGVPQSFPSLPTLPVLT